MQWRWTVVERDRLELGRNGRADVDRRLCFADSARLVFRIQLGPMPRTVLAAVTPMVLFFLGVAGMENKRKSACQRDRMRTNQRVHRASSKMCCPTGILGPAGACTNWSLVVRAARRVHN